MQILISLKNPPPSPIFHCLSENDWILFWKPMIQITVYICHQCQFCVRAWNVAVQKYNYVCLVHQRKNSFNRSITTCNIQERLEFCLVYSSSSLDAFCSFIIYMYVFNRRRFIHTTYSDIEKSSTYSNMFIYFRFYKEVL